MWRMYNPNPVAARVGDCSIRALCKAVGRPWEDVYLEVCINGYLMCDMPSSDNVWGAYLRKNGFYRKACEDCTTVEAFAEDHPKGIYVMCIGGHVVTIVDGDWYDTWDSGQERPAYYWSREE